MYKFSFLVPENHAEKVKDAVFEAGAGKIGNYDFCCWQVMVQGQFRALEGSNPYIGSQGRVEKISEIKVEMVCEESRMQSVILAMKLAHPYEEPAYTVIKLEDF